MVDYYVVEIQSVEDVPGEGQTVKTVYKQRFNRHIFNIEETVKSINESYLKADDKLHNSI